MRSNYTGHNATVQFKYLLIFILLSLALSNKSRAQWIADPALNTVICTDTNSQFSPVITSDGAGGAIIAWKDQRNGPNTYGLIYAQHMNAFGQALWPTDGYVICDESGFDKADLVIVSDGSGGAIIAWRQWSSLSGTDIYAQRINSSGVTEWTDNGIPICTAYDEQRIPAMIADGSGGAIITWMDRRNSWFGDIYAQRIDGAGNAHWPFNGRLVCGAASSQDYPVIISDDSGGAIISWMDIRNDIDYNIYAQRINSVGFPLWQTNGVAVCSEIEYQLGPAICSDGWGGAIITWMDHRNQPINVNMYEDIYAQRINSSGVIQWAPEAVPVCIQTNQQILPILVADGSGGSIVTWQDARNGHTNIFAQRINAAGNIQWNMNGIAIAPTSTNQQFHTTISDNLGGAIVSWCDIGDGSAYADIYAQRVRNNGSIPWASTGIEVSVANDHQFYPQMVSDGHDGAIVTWEDYRVYPHSDIYAQNISGAGITGGVISVPSISALSELIHLFPNPSNGIFHISMEDPSGQGKNTSIVIYNSVGEKIYSDENFLLPSPEKIDISLSGNGIYFLELKNGENIFIQKIVVQ